ncbi:MAG: NAD(P)-dependent oxidoreductase [Vicinamibacteria bacterium]|jgi:3-hydroxyisobutyrate dehydrogenase-like beta-hydroxyacid dehydrogenase|nr:NAD(P)-dependent oxidoreductase [Vicinamibacteria bacterium]
MTKRVGMAGLGIMGQGMAQNLLKKGVLAAVWNRNAERSRLFADRVPIAASPCELAQQTDVVVACVADPAAVEQVVFGEQGVLRAARPGFRYIETSTITPELNRRVAAAFRERGAEMIEAPVTGSKLGARDGTLLFMVGGRQEVFDELEPVLLMMGKRAIYCGESGQGALMKLVGNTLASFLMEGLSEALVLGQKGGLTVEAMIEMIMASGFTSPYFAFKGGAIARRDFETHFAIDLLHKDQTLILNEATLSRTPMPALASIREVFQAARAQGLGGEDMAAVVKVLERAADLSK